MDKVSPFDHAAREFLTWARVETGLSPSTLEAYGRDLRYMKEYLVGAGVKSPDAVRMEHLAQHLQQLKRERGLDSSTSRGILHPCVFFFAGYKRKEKLSETPRACWIDHIDGEDCLEH